MHTDPQPATYEGSSRRLVVAFDVGTTFSGISYAFLDPGSAPKICSLTKYPGQASGGSSKIPTVMYYDSDGNMKCAGAETLLPENEMDAEEEGWIKVDWFKLRLRPSSMPSKLENAKLPPLPTGKNIVDVFGDFLRYLMLCTEKFIKETYSTVTDSVWNTLREDMVIVLAHPNGWEGAQQKQMREAAALAKIIPNTTSGQERVVFVSEGEASLHFCVRGEYIDDAEKGFVIADLGGGTLDFSAYKVSGKKPLKVEEMDASKCVLEGSVLVTQRAHVFLRKKLEGSTYGEEKTIQQMSDKFDETTKKVFRTKGDTCLVVFGSPRDDDKAYGIRGGRLKLAGEEVAAFFEPSIKATVKAVEEHIEACPIKVSAVYMVGGFSASPYLKAEVEARLKSHRIKVATPDGQAVKAVADGAVSFYIDHYVMARVAKVSYGVICSQFFEDTKPDHVARRHLAYVSASGDEYIPSAFATILKKGTVVSEETEFRDHFHREFEWDAAPQSIRSAISVYPHAGDPPAWVDEMPERPKQLCVVVADMTKIKSSDIELSTREGGRYKSYNYDIILFFGGPELKAQTAWTENGVEKRGPAEIIYDSGSSSGIVSSSKSSGKLGSFFSPEPHERSPRSGFLPADSRIKVSTSKSSRHVSDSSGHNKSSNSFNKATVGWKTTRVPNTTATYGESSSSTGLPRRRRSPDPYDSKTRTYKLTRSDPSSSYGDARYAPPPPSGYADYIPPNSIAREPSYGSYNSYGYGGHGQQSSGYDAYSSSYGGGPDIPPRSQSGSYDSYGYRGRY